MRRPALQPILIGTPVLLGVLAFAAGGAEELVETRAAWVHPQEYLTTEAARATLEKAGRANLNALFVLVKHAGYVYYRQSPHLAVSDKVAADFDPVANLIEEAHRRGLEFHAWFVNGSLAYNKAAAAPVYRQHPEWFLTDYFGRTSWRFGDLGCRAFFEHEAAVMVDFARRYPADGIHFDYIRYPGNVGMRYCYCAECRAAFKQQHGADPGEFIDTCLPCTSRLNANSFTRVTTGQVVAVFEDDLPAVVVNKLGQGTCILFNFSVNDFGHPAVEQMARAALEANGQKPPRVQLLQSAETEKKYGPKALAGAQESLGEWGLQVKVLATAQLAQADRAWPLVLPNVYLLSETVVADLQTFVRGGGRLIVWDGPTPSAKVQGLAELLGVKPDTRYSHQVRTMKPGVPCAFVVARQKPLPPDVDELLAQWDRFRTDRVTALVRKVHAEAKRAKPDVWVTAAVFHNKKGWEDVHQDWPTWVKNGWVDYVLPMCYTPKDEEYRASLAEWRADCGDYTRIVGGVGAFEGAALGDPKVALAKVDLLRQAGVRGASFFVLNKMPEALLTALREGPFREKARPYHPSLTKAPPAE